MGLIKFFKKKYEPELNQIYLIEDLYRNFSYVVPVNDRLIDPFVEKYCELEVWCRENSFRKPFIDRVIYEENLKKWTSNTFGYDKIFIATNSEDAYLLGMLRWG